MFGGPPAMFGGGKGGMPFGGGKGGIPFGGPPRPMKGGGMAGIPFLGVLGHGRLYSREQEKSEGCRKLTSRSWKRAHGRRRTAHHWRAAHRWHSHGRHPHWHAHGTSHAESSATGRQVGLVEGVGLALAVVGVGDAVDDLLRLV